MKYGKLEFERTFLLDEDCVNTLRILNTKQILDKYIEGTHLRLRKVISKEITTYKLTQKEALNPPQIGIRKINTLYLSKETYDLLNVLSGIEIEKERHYITIDQIKIGVDCIIFEDQKMYLAEVEFETAEEMNAFNMPMPHLLETTAHPNYSGYVIAKKYQNEGSINLSSK